MADYFLPHHVHFCFRGNAVVFLDLRRDDYTLVNGDAATALRTLLAKDEPGAPKPDSADALTELLASGLLTTDRSSERSVSPTEVELALECLVSEDSIPEIHMTIGHVWNFIAACVVAAVRLRWWRIEHTVGLVGQRKARQAHCKPVDMDKARELTAIFQRLRSFFPRNYLCLYDSLALIEFLARYQIYPTWVFGVRLEPWAAHCWVQEAQFVFNEGVEEAANYTPIMAI